MSIFTKEALNPARGTNEDYQDYRERRTALNHMVKRYLQQGKLAFVSAMPQYSDDKIAPTVTGYKTKTYRKPQP